MAYIKFTRERGFEYNFSEGEFFGFAVIILVVLAFVGWMVKG